MRSLPPWSVLLFAIPLSCDLQQTADQLQAQQVMVATLLATPPVTLNPAAFVDAGAFDAGGFSFDGGFVTDAGQVTIPSQTVAFVYFGERSSQSLDAPPTPISDAVVTVAPSGGAPVTLPGDGGGSYAVTSQQVPSFQYQSGATYDFTAAEGPSSPFSGTYVGEVQQVPDVESIPDLHPAGGYISIPAGTDFSFNRPDPPPGQARNLGFVEVFPVDDQGNQGQPTYTNIPQTPVALLQLVAAPSQWKQTNVDIPGAQAFPNPQSTYLIVFDAVKQGGPSSDNLFTGSAILAGSADIGVVRTQ